MSLDVHFDYLNEPICPVTGFEIIPRPEWTFTTTDDHYTGYITQVGNNIFIYKAVGRPTLDDSPLSAAHVRRFLRENLAAGQRFYALFDYSELTPPPVRNRTNLLHQLKSLLPKLHLVVFFNMRPRMRTVVNIALHLSSIRESLFTAKMYRDALSIVKTDMLRKGIQNTISSPQNEIAVQLMGLLGRLIWEEEYDTDVPHLPPDHEFFEVFEAISLLRDDLRAAQEENRHKQELLEKANQVKDEFIENMSHEIRTPLNGIIGAANLLEKTRPNEEQQRCIRILKESSRSLLAGVNQLLDLAALDTGQQERRSKAFHLSDLFSSTSAIFEPACREKSLGLQVYVDDELPEFIASDADRIRQVLINLLANAVKYTHHGSIIVEVEGQLRQDILFLAIRIRDSGIGIPEAMQGRLFQRFSRGFNSSPDTNGSGLGLNISRGLARQLGGDLRLESTSAQGSVFLFELPVSVADCEDFERTGPSAEPDAGEENPAFLQWRVAGGDQESGRRKRALVVDDDAINRDVLCGFLAHMQIDSTQAASAVAAIDLFEQGDFDILFVDCSMPDIDGMVLTKHLRDTFSRSAQMPIIGVTAYSDSGKIAQMKEAGMNDVLSKPLGIRKIEEAIRRHLGVEEAEEEAPAPAPVQQEEDDSDELDPELIAAMCDRIKQYLETELPEMRKALESGDWPHIKLRAHSLHGVLAQLGIRGEAKKLRVIEQAAGEQATAERIEQLMAESEATLRIWHEKKC